MGTIVVSAALILPVLLSLVFNFAEKIAIKPISQWFWADGRQQLPGVSLAMQALLVALAVNIGVGAMVSSFRETFTSWLDQRLAAEIYINAQGNDKTSIQSWLNNQQDILAVLPINYAEANFQDEEIPVMGITAHETYSENWPLLSKIEQGWQEVADGSGVLINEQLARRKGISINDKINLETPTGVWSPHIAGIYSDYGNTQGQFMADINQLQSRWERDGANLFLVRSDPKDISGIMKRLAARFNLNETQMVNQQQMKSLSKQIFERTFSVTAALNVLTLIIAGVALLTSLLSLANSRLSQVAPLWAMGLTQGRLSILDLAKTLSLALFTGLLAIPLGIILGWLLTSIINVEAFGWKLPLFHYPFQWLTLIILALTIAGIASIPSIIKLRTISAAKLLKVFSDAR